VAGPSRTPKPQILVIGSSNTDLIISAPRFPGPGETILGGAFTRAAGGKGANQAVAAARAGGAVTFVARVGRDANGDEALRGFREAGVNVRHVIRDHAAPSGVAFIIVTRTGENCITVASGANDRLSPADVRRARSAFRRANVGLLQLESPIATVEAAVELATAAGLRLLLNPAPARALPRSLLERVYLLTPNESEAERLTGMVVNTERSAARAADKLLKTGVSNVVITMGSRGAFVAGNGVRHMVRGLPVKAVDTTGAGDVFNGALAVAIAEGRPLLESARFANAAAACSVTRTGAQPSAPSRRDINAMLSKGRV
jgi:ribokinase